MPNAWLHRSVERGPPCLQGVWVLEGGGGCPDQGLTKQSVLVPKRHCRHHTFVSLKDEDAEKGWGEGGR